MQKFLKIKLVCWGQLPICLCLPMAWNEMPFYDLQKLLWLPKNVRTLKYSYLQALLEKHAIDTIHGKWYNYLNTVAVEGQ